jgi:hypothetical protein
MTPTQEWIMGLALVYAIPSFISGVGVTLLFIRRHEIRDAMAMMPRFLSPKSALEPRDTAVLAPADEHQALLPGGLGLR